MGLCLATSPRHSQHLLSHCLVLAAGTDTPAWCVLCDELGSPLQILLASWAEAVGSGKLHFDFLKKGGKPVLLSQAY